MTSLPLEFLSTAVPVSCCKCLARCGRSAACKVEQSLARPGMEQVQDWTSCRWFACCISQHWQPVPTFHLHNQNLMQGHGSRWGPVEKRLCGAALVFATMTETRCRFKRCMNTGNARTTRRSNLAFTGNLTCRRQQRIQKLLHAIGPCNDTCCGRTSIYCQVSDYECSSR